MWPDSQLLIPILMKSQPDFMAFNSHQWGRVMEFLKQKRAKSHRCYLLSLIGETLFHHSLLHSEILFMHLINCFSDFYGVPVGWCWSSNSVWRPHDNRHLFISPISETVHSPSHCFSWLSMRCTADFSWVPMCLPKTVFPNLSWM